MKHRVACYTARAASTLNMSRSVKNVIQQNVFVFLQKIQHTLLLSWIARYTLSLQLFRLVFQDLIS